MKELLFVGHCSGPGGYERHGRLILKGLVENQVKVQIIELPYTRYSVYLPEDHRVLITQAKATQVSLTAPVMFLCVPNLIYKKREDGQGPYFGRKNISYTTFEADRICDEWVRIGNTLDLTIVTNKFIKQVWIESGVKEKKVEVVGEGTFPELFYPEVEPLELVDENGVSLMQKHKNRFIAVMEYSPRKNFEGLLKAFVKAFEGDEETCLIIKLSKLENWMRRLPVLDVNTRKAYVYIYDFLLPDFVMPRFLAVGTHYFSLSHGEGWDLTCNDMAAMKKVLVVPAHTAYLSYLNSDIAYLVKADKKVPAYQPPPLDVFFKGAHWWEPDIDDAVDKLRASVNKDNTVMIEHLYTHIMKYYTWKNVGKNLVKVLTQRGIL
ncbi:MAG TPA: hypothetical protein P5140_05780 [Methanofastidiosum sp.]|nr:hypothetical protein [Methanofastidiosum sp.]